MQDYFKYDKIQGAASLYMKSDSDGSTDKEKRSLPLGIKSTVQGVKHFTNWDDIASSIDRKNSLRFEDSQPNSVSFSMPNRKALSTTNFYNDNKLFNIPYNSQDDELSFVDSWEAEDISIIDNLAFVSYPEYTDINREDLNFGTINLKQPVKVSEQIVYDGSAASYLRVGGITLSSEQIPYNHKIYSKRNDGVYTDQSGIVFLPNNFASFDNCILKVEFTGTIDGKTTLGGTDSQYFAKKTLYFTYGGAVANDINTASERSTVYSNPDTAFRYNNSVSTHDLASVSDGDYGGQFFLVTTKAFNGDSDPSGSVMEGDLGNDEDRVVNIQLSTFFNPNSWTNYTNNNEYTLLFNSAEEGGNKITVKSVNIEATVSMMKITPVRKCGKVDIYRKKSGKIYAVSLLQKTLVYSFSHNLKTNDIINITSALFDGEQTGAVDIHPLNGKKFVKVVDSNSFYIYEDEFFQKPTSIENIQNTFTGPSIKLLDGVNWICIGNSFGDEGGLWEFQKTVFSPTGRNGYLSKKNTDITYSGRDSNGNSSTPMAELDTFTTTQRLYKTAFSTLLNNSKLNSSSPHSLFLDFSKPTFSLDAEQRSIIGNLARDLEHSIPQSTLGKSVFSAVNKGPQDYYPFHCAGNINSIFPTANEENTIYTGNRFGCSLDVKFSHVSGTSKVYTLAVGERGSDISVDLFGAASTEEYAIDGNVPYFETSEDSIYNTFRQRIIPDNLPHGKIHVITITVDRFGFISNISHKNTINGDGSSINSAAGLETPPWENWIDDLYGFKWRNKEYINGDLRHLIYSPHIYGAFQYPYGNMLEALPMSISYDVREAPFGETMINNSSLYWDRAAVTNWQMADIYDYFRNETGRQHLLRDLSTNRNNIPTSGQDGENSSRFGYSGIGSSVPIYTRIDRFDLSHSGENSQWYIFPWVDSFGKSVAIGDRNNDGSLLIFGGVTTRSNIDFENINDVELSVNLRSNNLKRPLLSSRLYNDYEIEEDKTQGEIGQISCVLLDSDYKTSKFFEINSGGSVDSSRTPDPTQVIPIRGNLTFSPTVKTLRSGNKTGNFAYNSTLSSYWSTYKILYKDGFLMWADQLFGDRLARINVLSHDKSNNSFLPKSTVDNNFTLPFGNLRTCEGFGLDLRFDNNLLITNCLTSTNDFNQSISDFGFSQYSTYDTLMVYSFENERFNFIQKVSATIDKNDEKYTDRLFNQYEEALLEIGNVSYDNTTVNSLTWNIRLLGKYDVVDDKILLKDPLEYVLLGRDYSYDKILSDNQLSSSYEAQINPYFYYNEIFNNDTVYYDYSSRQQFLVKDHIQWDNSPSDQYKIVQTVNEIQTPVFFLSLPFLDSGYYGDLSIVVNKESLGRQLGSYIDLDSGNRVTDTLSVRPSLPKVVLYKKDPRSMITPNGSITQTYGYNKNQFDIIYYSEYDALTPTTPPYFRGGAHDLFFYGKRLNSVPTIMPEETLGINYEYDSYFTQYYGGETNLGELYDATYVSVANGGFDKGIVSWVAPDVYYYQQSFRDVVPYAYLHTQFTTIGDNEFLITIPYSIWKDYIVENSLIKNSNNNRPFFDTFTRIKHGTVGQTSSPLEDGSWVYSYDDINQPCYNSNNLYSGKSLMLGFVYTAASSVDISTNTIITTDSSTTTMSQYWRAMEEYKAEKRHRYNARYSYAPIIGNTDSTDPNLNFAKRTQVMSNNTVSTINNLEFNIGVNRRQKRQFNTKFHKIAYYEYNKAVYSEVQKNLIDLTTSQIDRYAFGRYSFTPLPVGLSEEFEDSNVKLGGSKNPIIRCGKSNDPSYTIYSENGQSSKSITVLTSDSLVPFGLSSQINTNYYVDITGDKLYYEGFANFASQNLLGGFDLDQPNYLSLSIKSIPSKNTNATLFTKNLFASGEIPLYSSGVGASNSNATLWTGYGVHNDDMDMVIKSFDSDNYISLSIEEVKPSGFVSLEVSGPSSTGNIPLSFSPPGTGDISLNIRGPFGDTDDLSLATRGKSQFIGRETLHTSGIYATGVLATLNIAGRETNLGNIPLVMNIPKSGSLSLFTFAPYSDTSNPDLYITGKGYSSLDSTLFVGTQYDIAGQATDLVIKDTQQPSINDATLYTGGSVGFADNLLSRKGDSNIIRNRDVIDITENSEIPVSLTFDSSTSISNSITRKNIKDSYYSSKIKKLGSPTNIYLGSQKRNNYRKNPSFITKQLDTANNKAKAFYYDGNLLSGDTNSVIKRDAYDANGKNLALAYCNNKSVEIDIYDIVDNKFTNFAAKLCLGPAYEVPSTNSSLDINYAINGIQELPFGDSFIAIRRALKEYFTATSYEENDLQEDSKIVVNNLKLSNLGHCAISLTCKINYSTTGFDETKLFDIVVVFHINDIKSATSNISGYFGLPTYYVENYSYKIYERSGSGYNTHSSAYSLAFDNEDLYFDRRFGSFGQIWKLSSISSYRQDALSIDFNLHPDANAYINNNNAFYIDSDHRKAAFGVPIKIFDDYSVAGGKIMFIGAHLFDPYVFNSLSAPHIPNAVGAVYVYKKASDNSNWAYFGAMYGHGNTSNDMPAAVVDYKNSDLGNERYGLFGYDFDYFEGRFTVSEPGGYGDDPLNLPRIYLYEITSNDIHLLRTLIASDVDAPYPEPDPSEDNFGSHIVMLDKENPISLSEQSFVSTFNNTLAYKESPVTTLLEAKTNLSNETKFYETTQIANLSQDLVTRSEDVYSIKKLDFGNGKYKIGAIRSFNVSTLDPYNSDPNYNFDIEKLFILEANKSPMSLFITGPLTNAGSVNLMVGGLGFVDSDANFYTFGKSVANSGISLNIREQREQGDIFLHIESLKENYSPLYMSGSVVPLNSGINLSISPIPNMNHDTTMYMSGIGVGLGPMDLKIAGSLLSNAVGTFDMYIGQDIDASENIKLYMNAGGSSTVGAILSQDNETLSISGRSSDIFDTNSNSSFYITGPDSYTEISTAPLYITTDIPEIGIGGYIHSGDLSISMSGNNDAGIFTGAERFTSLYLNASEGLIEDTSLFIERPTVNVATLSIRNQNPTGVIPISVSGAYLSSGNISLIISPPTENNVTIFTRGYLE